MTKQTYNNYYKAYWQTDKGKRALKRANKRWKKKLKEEYGTKTYYQAYKLHRAKKQGFKEDLEPFET